MGRILQTGWARQTWCQWQAAPPPRMTQHLRGVSTGGKSLHVIKKYYCSKCLQVHSRRWRRRSLGNVLARTFPPQLSFPGSQAPPSVIWEPPVAMTLWKWTSNGKGHRRETSRTWTLEALHFLLMPPSDILLAGQIGFRIPNAKGENRAWWDPPRANGDLLIINVIII